MLPPDSMEKEYEQNVRTPFDFSAGKTCFMEGSPLGGLFIMCKRLPIVPGAACRGAEFVRIEACIATA